MRRVAVKARKVLRDIGRQAHLDRLHGIYGRRAGRGHIGAHASATPAELDLVLARRVVRTLGARVEFAENDALELSSTQARRLIFFGCGAQCVPQAVARINSEFASEISRIQTENPTDSVVIHREPDGGSDLTIRNWTDIIAVFAVKTAGADADATDVVTIDEERIDLIRQVFWDMNAVSWHVQTIHHKDSTETILHITITSKKAEEMPNFYHFNKSQREALTEVLKPEYAQMLAELVGTYGGEVTLDEAQIRAMLSAMPKDISERRKAVVEKAYSLLGKVNYFWGGKSSAIGWDSRWGKPTRVTAAGSRTTGTIRPYGLDCSGFVDWVFNNSLGYVIGHGGGAASQHDHCKSISWSEAQPGDLVFYPGDTHVGVFVGKNSNGDPLIIHCASSQNNVVLTGLQGFVSIGRPDCF